VKLKALIVLLGILCPLSLFSQQAVYQLSDGGLAWGSKFTQFDSEVPIMDMGIIDEQALMQEDLINDQNKVGTYRFGYNHFVNFNLNNSGVWRTLENGDKVWRIGFSCPNAITINLAFQYLSIPDGAKLFIYNDDRSVVLGGFSQAQVSPELQLGTELIPGETVYVEYYVPAGITNVGSLEVFRVTHGYRSATDFVDRAFGGSGACENNARCPAYASHDNQIRSVVCLVSGGSEFCSGALINNTCNNGTPYVLTANHCGTTGIGSWVFRFNWEAPGCTNPGSSPSTAQSISGGTLRANSSGSDFNLVQINSSVPAGYAVYFAGWDRSTTGATNPFGVHHPAGDIKKFSQSTGTATQITINFNGNPTTMMWQTPTWTDGVTEPGSSGSPLFNSSGQIIGQLGGGPSDCTCENNASCGYDYYGRIDISWVGGGTAATRLSDWLAPSGCGAAPTSLVGYDPNTPTLTYDAQLQSVTSPTGTYCTGSNTPVVVLKNNGTVTLTGMTINYNIDGGANTPAVWSGSLASGASVSFNMPAITIAAGAHTYNVSIVTASLNGSNTDLNTANNSGSSSYTGVVPTSTALPLAYGFEPTAMPPTTPGVWTLNNGLAGTITFARTTTAFSLGTASCWLNYYNDGPTPAGAGTTDDLIMPYLDFSGVGAPTNMTFDVAYRRYGAGYDDSLRVMISTNCGTSWTTVYTKGGTTLATVTGTQTASGFTPTAAQWRNESISLNAYAGLNNVLIKFQGYSAYGQNIYFDNINITGTVATPPTASFTTSGNTICAGQTVTYTSTSTGGPTSISWAFPGGTPPTGTTTPITVTYATAGTYTTTLTATNGAGFTTTTQTITVNSLPTNTASNTGAYCPGATIQLNATAGATDYDWVGPNAFAMNNTQNPTIAGATAVMAGVYTVTVTNAAGCTATATTTVVINSSPSASASNTGPYCPGGTISLSSTGSATNDWVGPNSYVQNNMQNPTISGATIAMDGVYTVTVTNGSGCTATATTTVVVVNTSSATATNTGPYCVGQTISLNALAGGTGYAWTGPSSYSAAIQAPSIASSTLAMAGVYSVTITFPGGCTSSATTTVAVNSNPSAPIITPGGPTTFCTGNSVTLTSSYGSGNVWSTSATTVSVNVNSGGTYSVTYTDVNGCTATASQAVTVNSLPTVTQSSLGTVCSSYAPVVLSGGSPTGGSYSGTGVSAGMFDPAVSGTGTFSITYTYTDVNSCTNTASSNIIVSPCTGVETSGENAINIYPNPTTQFIYVTGLTNGDHPYSITGTLGQMIRVGVMTGDGMIDLGTVASGTYYIKIDNKFWKIIKQ
jgi:lysyl endopeptidase